MGPKRPDTATNQTTVAAQAAPSSAETTGRRVVVVMPAYNAAKTLERTYRDIPHDMISKIILVDDVSKDDTVAVARQLGLDVIIHRQNLGYGGNQKTCYDAALEAGAVAGPRLPLLESGSRGPRSGPSPWEGELPWAWLYRPASGWRS